MKTDTTIEITNTKKHIILKKAVTIFLLLCLIITSTANFDILNIGNPIKVQAKSKSVFGAFNRNGLLLNVKQSFQLSLSKVTLNNLEEKADENGEDYQDVLDSITWEIKNKKVASIKASKVDSTQCEVTGLQIGYTNVVATVDIGGSTKKFICNVDVFNSKTKFDYNKSDMKKHFVLIRPCTTNSPKYNGKYPAFVKLTFDAYKEKRNYVDAFGDIYKKGTYKGYKWYLETFNSSDDYNNYVNDNYMPDYNDNGDNFSLAFGASYCGVDHKKYVFSQDYKNVFSHPYIYYKENKKGDYIIYGCDNKDGSGKKYR